MLSLDENQLSSDYKSVLQKRYICFCERPFESYSGIYCHLKTKHENLFSIYRENHIKKMLKKSKGYRGTLNYKLIELSQEGISRESKVQKSKKTNSSHQSKNQKQAGNLLQNPPILDNQKTSLKGNSIRESEQNEIDIQYQNQQIQRKSSPVSQKAQKDQEPPLLHLEAEMLSFSSFPDYSPQSVLPFPPMFPNSPMTIKAFLVSFLFQSPEYNRDQTKTYLYDLMVFIDKNRHLAKDPRIEGRFLLSYCDQFDPQYIRPLLNQFIEKLESELRDHKNQLKQEQTYHKKMKIYCVEALRYRLGQAGLLRLEETVSNQAQLKSQPKERQVKE